MNIGLYIHIPFCTARCNYCHFVTRPWEDQAAARYYRAVLEEMKLVLSISSGDRTVDTIYFGGGTPSLAPDRAIVDILSVVRERIHLSGEAEVSLEANPDSLTSEKARAYQAMGINRISLGAQTFQDSQLLAAGRDHSGEDTERSVSLLRKSGIDNINLDLMLGLPGQDLQTWNDDLSRAVELEPRHLSVYMLDLDDRSPLFHEIGKGKKQVPEDELVADLYFRTIDFLSSRGYEQYEISNFALPGYRSRHNLKYWRREPVLGFGVGSHSFDGTKRYANTANFARYVERAGSGQNPCEWDEQRNEKQELEEALFVGLRLTEGIDWEQLKSRHPESLDLIRFETSLLALSANGLLEWHDAQVRLTRQGMIFSNEVLREFV